MLEWNELDNRAVDTARILAADAVESVGNGHPGTAMSLAPAAYLLFQKVMNHNPANPRCLGRDRFILSIGHSSLTLYNQLFLGGFGLELDDIKNLRRWGSKTPGHPEYAHTDGVEITTGPLGQGLASATGFAYSQRFEKELFDAGSTDSPFDHFVYVFASDGDIQEGVSAEAASLAGHQKLGNLVVIYDSNQISIEDDTDIAFTEDVNARYEAYGWHTQTVDWNITGEYKEDLEALYEAIQKAKQVTDKPSLITLKTIIGWPAPNKQNTGGIHGAKLGEDEVRATKEILGFDPDQNFQVEPEVLDHSRKLLDRGSSWEKSWQSKFDSWKQKNPEKSALLQRLIDGDLPENLEAALPRFEEGSMATRAASGKVINAIAQHLPELWGGSADLAGSNNTTIESADSFAPAEYSTDMFTANHGGRVLHFGIREHAMGSILNGIALSGHTRPFAGTFLVFSDYMRPAVRLAALMGVPAIYVWTHDSIALGEDGPTHQPIEHLTALRAIPNLTVIRPADANETSEAWLAALKNTSGPTALVLTRQNLPVMDKTTNPTPELVHKGGYVIGEAHANPDGLILATGSEVSIALQAKSELEQSGKKINVVSMPSFELFDAQDQSYKDSVLPPKVTKRVSVEAGLAMPWGKYVGSSGASVSIETFGASASYEVLYEKYGMTVSNVVKTFEGLDN
ncbi:MAG TPA: transketolase [Microbacteriaceae bacterium]